MDGINIYTVKLHKNTEKCSKKVPVVVEAQGILHHNKINSPRRNL